MTGIYHGHIWTLIHDNKQKEITEEKRVQSYTRPIPTWGNEHCAAFARDKCKPLQKHWKSFSMRVVCHDSVQGSPASFMHQTHSKINCQRSPKTKKASQCLNFWLQSQNDKSQKPNQKAVVAIIISFRKIAARNFWHQCKRHYGFWSIGPQLLETASVTAIATGQKKSIGARTGIYSSSIWRIKLQTSRSLLPLTLAARILWSSCEVDAVLQLQWLNRNSTLSSIALWTFLNTQLSDWRD